MEIDWKLAIATWISESETVRGKLKVIIYNIIFAIYKN
jgi:hypothetical protein